MRGQQYYSLKLEHQKVHVFQTIGGKEGSYDVQHDAVNVRLCSKLNKRSIRNIFNEVSKSLKQELDEATLRDNGTTAVIAYLSPDNTLITGHLGDSAAVLFLHNKTSGAIRARRLTSDHSLDRKSEKLRVQKQGGQSTVDGYILKKPYMLAVTRAFGDTHFGKLVSETPEIKEYNLSSLVRENEQAYICVASDGLFSEASLRPLANYFNQLIIDKVDSKKIPKLLAQHALDHGSDDNISLALCKLEKLQKKPFLISVFDGHGDDGRKVSSAASRSLTFHVPG